jgi:cystathionine beta-lyase/cystathionine gamma-synthase
MRFETIAPHGGDRPDTATGVISVPICQTSTSVFEDIGQTTDYRERVRITNELIRLSVGLEKRI